MRGIGQNRSMSDQQGTDDRQQQDPYPSDQQFGARAAQDQERVDRGEEPVGGDDVRPGTKAE